MYTDILTRIKNAQQAGKSTVKLPYSEMDYAVLTILANKGFISGVSKKGRMPKRILEVELKYHDGEGAINGIRFLSVPSRRLYAKTTELKKVKQGYGLALISTSAGIMTFDQAKKAKIGGQVLFEIW